MEKKRERKEGRGTQGTDDSFPSFADTKVQNWSHCGANTGDSEPKMKSMTTNRRTQPLRER